MAGKAGELLKKTVLELGGSDAYLVLEDADLEAVDHVCHQPLINAGQSCIAAKRFIVVEPSSTHLRTLREKDAAGQGRHPLAEQTQVGPLARHDLRETAPTGRASWPEGRMSARRDIPDGRGAFYPPTVLTNVTKGMPAYDEELFGPVAAIIPVRDEAQPSVSPTIPILGLGAAVFTRMWPGERFAATSWRLVVLSSTRS